MLSAQYVVVLYWQYFLVLFCCYVVPLHSICYTIPWYSDCSASILLFLPCSGILPVFRCSTGVPCSVVPCSGVPGFTVCPTYLHRRMDWWRESAAKHTRITVAINPTPQGMRHLNLFVFVEAIFELPLTARDFLSPSSK